MNTFKFLLATQADWITTSFPIIRYVLIGIIFLCAIVLTITVLLQSEDAAGGTNAISGIQESYYSQNKGETRDGKLKKITILMVSIMAICMILYFVSLFINRSII